MSRADCEDLVLRAVTQAILRDGSSGGCCRMAIITKVKSSLWMEGTLGFLVSQSPKFYKKMFSYSLDLYRILIGQFLYQSFFTMQPLIVIYRRGNHMGMYINLLAIVLSPLDPQLNVSTCCQEGDKIVFGYKTKKV